MPLIFIDTFILKNCDVTTPNARTIRVSCDSSHPILVTLTCANNCNNPMVTSNGSIPLTMTGLDPGIMYNVTINVFDGNQVVFRNQTIVKNITLISDQSGKIYIRTYVCIYIHTYICIHIHIILCSFIYVCLCVHIHTYVYVHTYTGLNVYTHSFESLFVTGPVKTSLIYVATQYICTK